MLPDNPLRLIHQPRTSREVLQAVAEGDITPEAAADLLAFGQIAELGDAVVDLQRQARRGRPEAVFCQGKTPEQIVTITRSLLKAGQNALLTRIDEKKAESVLGEFSDKSPEYDAQARCLAIRVSPAPPRSGIVGVICAGTSDLPVAREAAFCARFYGSDVETASDVGVAGLHRLLGQAELLLKAKVLIVVAGMEGALPSVVGGLVSCPVIAVPTSIGYGANLEGVTALLSMLTTCVPGISVVNIDNGFGAGYIADLINGQDGLTCNTTSSEEST